MAWSDAVRGGLGAVLLFGLTVPAHAGPPYETDDPAPIDKGHWEIYSFLTAEGRGGDFAGATGLDLNYGLIEGVQLTATLPLDVAHDQGTTAKVGDVETAIKYRFFNRADSGWSAAIFPRLVFPTGPVGSAPRRIAAQIPVWIEKDRGSWSLFGGGGYAINPGPDVRDYWFGGLALTRVLSENVSLGVEATRRGSDAIDSNAETALGIGATVKLGGPFEILASGGPTLVDHERARYRCYLAMGVVF